MNGLIYNQNHIPKEEYRYGFRASADTGCGWVATHNALHLMGYKTDIPELIRYYEWQLPLIHGNAGTSFWGPALCFRNWDFPVEISLDRRKFDEVARRSDVCILFYHWRREWKTGAHFVVVNGENASGVGLTEEQAWRMYDAGADVVTLGNHAFGSRDIYTWLDDNT